VFIVGEAFAFVFDLKCYAQYDVRELNMICNKKHRYLPEYQLLPDSQDNRSGDRHICAGCAYEEGLRDGLDGKKKKSDLSFLPESQAGSVRHKGAIEAYNEGYSAGLKKST
jgi:hypothetical protein